MKNKILKFVMTTSMFVFAFSACCLDSKNYIPFIISMLISGSIIMLFLKANNLLI